MNRQIRKKTLITAGIFTVLMLSVIIIAYIVDENTTTVFGLDKDHFEYLFKKHITLELYGEKYKVPDEIETYLFIGTDFSGNEEASGEDYQGSMADFLSLVVIDHTKETFGVLQLNRDTMTHVDYMNPDGSSYASAVQQLCTAHFYGGDKTMGCENTVHAVKGLLGQLPIDGYYSLSADDFVRVNALVGGVEITFTEDYTDINSRFKKGETLTLSDEEAYEFIRARMNVSDGTNLSRMARQKVYLQAFMEKIKELGARDAGFALSVFEQMNDYATTDITSKVISGLASDLYDYENLGFLELEGESRLGQALGDETDHMEFYPTQQSVLETLKKLCHFGT
ncbi:MAG: hypothetical protein E7294_00425 [Lachnospiraceae bacterium]|jgi:LCP family protein required for cell wall assembly|nr:hypothetical protein [Lachnospiraceae bacterium]